jgi:protein disulfide-isomerase
MKKEPALSQTPNKVRAIVAAHLRTLGTHSMVRGLTALMLFGAVCLFAGCDHSNDAVVSTNSPRAAEPARPAAGNEIRWFKGSMEQALAAAIQNNKLLMVYWGAKWCPYCQTLRKTVFTRADFIEKASLFIPVFMDGDLPGAQAWGEILKVSGYPTLLILKPDRTELARTSGGMDLTQYVSLLDDAIQDQRPIVNVLSDVHTLQDCHRLSFYGWDPAALQGVDKTQLATLLTAAAARCEGPEQVRLQIAALDFALQGKVDPVGLKPGVKNLYVLLDQPEKIRVAMDLLTSIDESLFTIVTQQGGGFAEPFRSRWVSRMLEAADDSRFSDADQLIAFASALNATKALTPSHAIPPWMQQSARNRVRQALALDKDRFKRNDLVNAAGIIDDALGDREAARELYLKELPNTDTPYYYMSHLATLAEEQGKYQEALDWMGKAYDASEGSATRLRWGSSYVRALIRLSPDDVARIRIVALRVAVDASHADAAHGRPRAAISQISAALDQWAGPAQRRSVAAEVKEHFSSIGGQLSHET